MKKIKMEKYTAHSSGWLKTHDDTSLFLRKWVPTGSPKAVVLVVHGMSEHSARYEEFAQVLCTQGYAVFAHDQRGHGQTGLRATLGHFADTDGWELVVQDVESVRKEIIRTYPGVPVLLFAHSMGSFIAQSYLIEHSKHLAGAMLCGSNYRKPWFYRIAQGVVGYHLLRQGPKGKSDAFHNLVFGSMNKTIKPRRTECDWLSRNPQEVDKYIQDPLCGFKGTNRFWLDYLQGMQHISRSENLAKISASLPLLVIGGDADPVSNGAGLVRLVEAFKAAGKTRTQLRLFAGARHELLNETNKAEVIGYVLEWLSLRINPAALPVDLQGCPQSSASIS